MLAVAIMAIGFSSCGKSKVNLDSPTDAVESLVKGMKKNDPSLVIKCYCDKNGNEFDKSYQKKYIEDVEEVIKDGDDDYYEIDEYKIGDVSERDGQTWVKVSFYEDGELDQDVYYQVKKGSDGKWRVVKY